MTDEQRQAFRYLLEELEPYGVRWGLVEGRPVVVVKKELPDDLRELVEQAGPWFAQSAAEIQEHKAYLKGLN